ncbi:MAG: hypothetical protein AB8D52_01830 [Gammaproteobacteria bacterium]
MIKAQSNYNALSYYLASLKFKSAKLAIFSCWEGDQCEVPEYKEKISLKRLISSDFEFKEKAYYEVT